MVENRVRKGHLAGFGIALINHHCTDASPNVKTSAGNVQSGPCCPIWVPGENVARALSSGTATVEVPVRMTPALGKPSGCYHSRHSKGFPSPGCCLLQVCPNLCLGVPVAQFSLPCCRFSQAQKIQSPRFGWVVFLRADRHPVCTVLT